MLITKINGTPLKEITFPLLKDFFVDHVFNAFMDNGRMGMTSAVEVMVTTMTEFIYSQPFANPDERHKSGLENWELDMLAVAARKRIMDGFICNGSIGIDSGVSSTYTELINTIRGW